MQRRESDVGCAALKVNGATIQCSLVRQEGDCVVFMPLRAMIQRVELPPEREGEHFLQATPTYDGSVTRPFLSVRGLKALLGPDRVPVQFGNELYWEANAGFFWAECPFGEGEPRLVARVVIGIASVLGAEQHQPSAVTASPSSSSSSIISLSARTRPESAVLFLNRIEVLTDEECSRLVEKREHDLARKGGDTPTCSLRRLLQRGATPQQLTAIGEVQGARRWRAAKERIRAQKEHGSMEPSWRAQRKQLEKRMRRWMPTYCLPERVESAVKGGGGGEEDEEEDEGSRGDGPGTVDSGAHSSRWRGTGAEAPPRGRGAGGDEQPLGSKTLLRVLHRRQERRKQERAHQQERREGGNRGALLEKREARRPQEEGRKELGRAAPDGEQEEGVKESAREAKRVDARRKIRDRELAGTRRDRWAAAREADPPSPPPQPTSLSRVEEAEEQVADPIPRRSSQRRARQEGAPLLAQQQQKKWSTSALNGRVLGKAGKR